MCELSRFLNLQLMWALTTTLAMILNVLTMAHNMRLVFERATRWLLLRTKHIHDAFCTEFFHDSRIGVVPDRRSACLKLPLQIAAVAETTFASRGIIELLA